MELGENLEIGYFEQEIKGENRNTCIDEIWEEFPSFSQYEVRSALAKCGLTTKHIESLVRVLSGGEQAKVRLCKLINKSTNVLLLDEPTNHLDVDAKDELKRALQEYRGSILLICMNRNFIRILSMKSGIARSGQQRFCSIKISIMKRKNIDIFITKYYLDVSNNSYY